MNFKLCIQIQNMMKFIFFNNELDSDNEVASMALLLLLFESTFLVYLPLNVVFWFELNGSD